MGGGGNYKVDCNAVVTKSLGDILGLVPSDYEYGAVYYHYTFFF